MPFSYPQIPNYGNLATPNPSVSAQAHPMPSAKGVLVPTNTGTLSPMPSNNNIDLEEYLQFAHVEMNKGGFVVALGKLGITHYLQFQNF
ncbi:uncharacterized protein VP01_2869g1 [Puccinia sorghi]|uniref:Uncharacterized protein n=1 Tax=Puccinia sorghi TaxID=27349 RepID=A0A0L6V2L7_9BASI|nr:uncharacterized protein VP01_2869g1 [Puccinia sorghi]